MDGESRIRLRGVRVHNLKNIDLDLPLHRIIVVTGVSGAGKSSLAFDTLYAEGQRRYIGTFSARTRQFLEKLDKPDADLIDSLPPAIAVLPTRGRSNALTRSTVGTSTEIHDHLSLLFAKIGSVFCPDCDRRILSATPVSVANAADLYPDGTRYLITFPIDVRPGSNLHALSELLRASGFTRVLSQGVVVSLEDGPLPAPDEGAETLDVVVDRLKRGFENPSRRLDSIETAFKKGYGRCRLIPEDGPSQTFLEGYRCPTCLREFTPPDPRLFRYRSPMGACRLCLGLGQVVELDLAKIVPDPSRTIREGAVTCWSTTYDGAAFQHFLDLSPKLGIPVDVPFHSISPERVRTIVEGLPEMEFIGLRDYFHRLERKTARTRLLAYLGKWRSIITCPSCRGTRLQPDALAVHVDGLNVASISALKIPQILVFLKGLKSLPEDYAIVKQLVGQTVNRLEALVRIGLHELTLDRPLNQLAGGEAQRVKLTSALGSGLVNTLYVLDEPSAGLHPQDVGMLIAALGRLRDARNTLILVEHDPLVIRAADLIVDLGPGAGEAGGQVLFVEPPEKLEGIEGSVTADYLNGKRSVPVPDRRVAPEQGFLKVKGARGNNLKNIDLDFPLGLLCVLTGVSGAGKSTLIEETIYPALRNRLRGENWPSKPYEEISTTSQIDTVTLIDQAPIGRSGRSNPVTYLKAFDEVRKTFAATHEAKLRNYTAARFSFNREGGRCDACEGNGFLKVEMQFLPDVLVRCAECQGTRYRVETLEITYRGKNIAEVLDMTAREAFSYFRQRPRVQARLRPLLDLGLEYLRLGQPASTLSGGEAQRLKLASYLSSSPGAITRNAGKTPTLFLLDEPTNGLHPSEIQKLIEALRSLLTLGHSLIVIEHTPCFMAAGDWVIELGPGGGDEGGRVVAEGTPEDLARADTPTGRVLAEILKTQARTNP